MENMDTSTPGIYYFAVIALGERERSWLLECSSNRKLQERDSG
jgi:hypothetical protein